MAAADESNKPRVFERRIIRKIFWNFTILAGTASENEGVYIYVYKVYISQKNIYL